jgi:Ca2+-binding EF-hand superfamily protein
MKFTQMFKDVDYDNNGTINESEFRDLISGMGVIE